MRHRSPLLLLACVLALSTGIALLRLSELAANPRPGLAPVSGGATDTAALVLVRRFYDAVNGTLRTGDPSPLSGLVAADLVEHPARLGETPGRAGLALHLVALHAAFPTLRLSLKDLIAQGDRVTTRVDVEGATTGRFLDLPVPAELAAWGPLDIFRVAGGQIVEHWASRPDPALIEPFRAGSLAVVPARPDLAVEHLTLAPRTMAASPGTLGATLLWAESGTPIVAIDAPLASPATLSRATDATDAGTPRPVSPGTAVTLQPGDLFRVANARYTIRNGGSTPALHVAVATETMPPFETIAGEADVQELADTLPASLRHGQVKVAVGRAMLAAGATLSAHAASGLQLLAVEEGTLDLHISDGVGWARRANGLLASVAEDTATLPPGGGALLGDGAVSALRNPGPDPATVLIVRITPDTAFSPTLSTPPISSWPGAEYQPVP